MKIIKHITEQPFIFATGFAALVHSTWSLGTLISGNEPTFGFSWLAWVIPAFALAFAFDVGQIVTSAEIRAGKRSHAKYATFIILALSTYYLQWLYIAHHMPIVDLGAGVRAEWSGFASLIRDSAIWVIPAFMPMSTLFYTFSSEPDHVAQPVQAIPIVTTPDAPLLEEPAKVISEVGVMLPPAKVVMSCPNCDWTKEYDDLKSAESGLRMHQRRYCVVTPVASSNGHNHG